MSLPNPFSPPPLPARFGLEIDDVLSLGALHIGWFNKVDGLEVTMKTEPYEEGGSNGFIHTLPGRLEWPNLKMTRGLTIGDHLFAWLEQTAEDYDAGRRLDPTTGRIKLYDERGIAIATWAFTGALPVKWTGPSFDATTTDLATEELEISHHGFTGREVTVL